MKYPLVMALSIFIAGILCLFIAYCIVGGRQ